jgi:hypothetical protein
MHLSIERCKLRPLPSLWPASIRLRDLAVLPNMPLLPPVPPMQPRGGQCITSSDWQERKDAGDSDE